ncbi:hypothetical protein C8F04DRAFT_1391102 [Mycena alexandri]|uniref:Uncharacterized protein n=1 Tax=Mycena alexandri TaxID=1745969 RepID=A0AAD6T9P9_9AGAR|nr:hypothetical protein C8F04DRAFT_1391102 [Mycena alexandri]
MPSQAGSSSGRQIRPSSSRKSAKKSKAPSSVGPPAASDSASARPSRLRVEGEDFTPSFLEERLTERQILSQYRLHYHLADPPLPDWQAINRRLEFAIEHVRGATYRLEAVESNAVDPSELRPHPVRPDAPPPLVDLPPLPELPFLDANAKPPHPLDDNLTAAQEAENFAFFEAQAARYRERKQICDEHSAECARLQLAHETAHWRAYEEDLEVWQAENVGLQNEIAEYQEELEFTRATLRECEEEYEKACTRAGRYIICHHEIKALTHHIIQLRDQVAYAHELKVALQGNVSLGPAIDVFLEASHLGEVPPGFSYRPVAEEPARPDVLSSLVSRKEVDPLERPGSRPQGTVPSPSPLGRKIFITVPALPSDSRPFAAPRGESSKKRTAVDEGAGRPAKMAKPASVASKPFSFKGRHTCALRRREIDFPLLAKDYEPVCGEPAGFESWREYLEGCIRATRLFLHFGTRKAAKFAQPCTKCAQFNFPCVADAMRTSGSCATCNVAKTKCVPSNKPDVGFVDSWITYQHVYASHFDPVRGHLNPDFAAPFDFDSWYPPAFDYRTDAEKRKGILFLYSKEMVAAGGGIVADAAGEGDVESEDGAEGAPMDVDAPPVATLAGSTEEPATAMEPVASSSNAAASGSRTSLPADVLRVVHRYQPSDLLGGSSARLPPPATYALEHHRAREDFSLTQPPDSCFGKLRPWNIPQEEYPLEIAIPRLHARRSWIMQWASEMWRMAVWMAGREFMMAHIRDSDPSLDVPPDHLSLPLIYGHIPFPCPVPALSNDAEWRSMALHKARSYTQTLAFARETIASDREGRLEHGEGYELAERMPDGWGMAELWAFFNKQEARVKQEVTETFVGEDTPPTLESKAASQARAIPPQRLRRRHTMLAGLPRSPANVPPDTFQQALDDAAPHQDDLFALRALEHIRFGSAGAVLGGRLVPFPMNPRPHPSSSASAPTEDEIPFESEGHSTSLSARLRSSSLADGFATPQLRRESPDSVKAEPEDVWVAPYIDGRPWNVDEEDLDSMDISGDGKGSS